MRAKRTIEVRITLDEDENDMLEVCAGVLDRTPDDVLQEILGDGVKNAVAGFLRDCSDEVKKLDARFVSTYQARSIAREVAKKRGLI